MGEASRTLFASRWYALIAVVAVAFAYGCDSDTGEGTRPLVDAAGDIDSSDVAPGDVGDDTGDRDTSADGGDTQICPLYQTRCDGECIPTSTDPDNCGGCGVTCGQNEVCSGGSCTDTCMTGLTACDRKCVDLESDSDHCGSCGNACPDGQGCVAKIGANGAAGSCVEAVDVGDRAEACAGGGPPIDLGDTVSVERQCSGNLAERTFRWGLCSCEDVVSNGEMYVDAYDSSTGPYVRGGEGGGVATNATIQTNLGVNTTGTLWAADEAATGEAVRTNGAARIGQRMHAGSSIRMGNGTTVGDDAYVDGDLDFFGDLGIGGTLHVPDSATIGDNVTYAALQRGPVDVVPPCGECAPESRVPVGEIVADHSGDNNDNASIGLDPAVFAGDFGSPRRLDLPCGHYYLSDFSPSQSVTIVAHGNTALYIDGDINANSQVTISLAPDAQLDVFVSGSVDTNSGLSLGSPNYPALLRVYVGGADGFSTNTGSRIGGYLYAVPGGVSSNGGAEVFGGVYGQSYSANAGGEIHFDRLITTVGEACPGDMPPPDLGVCGTKSDSCESSNDCCSPLVCGAAGECVLLECKPLNDECSQNDECCTGFCDGICIGR